MFKSLFSSLFVISVIQNNQTIHWSRCSPVSHILWQAPQGTWLSSRDGVEAPRHPSPKPRGAAAAACGDTGRECLETEGGGGRGREGRRGQAQGKTSRLKSRLDASAFCQQSHIHRNLLPCWQLLLVREVDVVPAPRCRCSSCLGRSTQIPHPRKSCPARVDKLLTAAWGMEQKAGGLDIWQALDVCLVSRGCLLCSPREHPRAKDRMFQPVLEWEWGGASRWAVSVRRWVLGCCAWRDGLEPGTHNTGMCWAVFLEKRAWCPCRSAFFCGSAFPKLQTVQPLLCGGYNLPTPLLTSLGDTSPSCWEGTWVTIHKDPSSLKRRRSVYQSWKITVWRRC